jgi:hypothetical protein
LTENQEPKLYLRGLGVGGNSACGLADLNTELQEELAVDAGKDKSLDFSMPYEFSVGTGGNAGYFANTTRILFLQP